MNAKDKKKNRPVLVLGMREFITWLKRLFRQPMFLFVTLWGNAVIFLSAVLFWVLERGGHAEPLSLFESYFWAISTATTVGAPNLVPITVAGKAVAIFLMVLGSLFLWTYTALFAAALVAPAFTEVGREVGEVERVVQIDRRTLESLIEEVRAVTRHQREHDESGGIRHP